MSHWSRGKTKIKDLETLKDVAMEMGCSIDEKKKLRNYYTGSVDCEFVISDNRGGKAAVVNTGNDEYAIQMDNWNNSLVEIIGQDGALLTREYMTEIVKREAQLMGGVIASQEIAQDGFVELEIHVSN